jgi:hypothetical protein
VRKLFTFTGAAFLAGSVQWAAKAGKPLTIADQGSFFVGGETKSFTPPDDNTG